MFLRRFRHEENGSIRGDGAEAGLIIWLASVTPHSEFNGCAGESTASASKGDIPTRPESSLVKLILVWLVLLRCPLSGYFVTV